MNVPLWFNYHAVTGSYICINKQKNKSNFKAARAMHVHNQARVALQAIIIHCKIHTIIMLQKPI